MTLFIQRAEHRDTQAIHAKLDELLAKLSEDPDVIAATMAAMTAALEAWGADSNLFHQGQIGVRIARSPGPWRSCRGFLAAAAMKEAAGSMPSGLTGLKIDK
jgi:hypothetical protein